MDCPRGDGFGSAPPTQGRKNTDGGAAGRAAAIDMKRSAQISALESSSNQGIGATTDIARGPLLYEALNTLVEIGGKR